MDGCMVFWTNDIDTLTTWCFGMHLSVFLSSRTRMSKLVFNFNSHFWFDQGGLFCLNVFSYSSTISVFCECVLCAV